MKFNRILEQYVRESEALTKIVVKVDPLNNSRKDYRDLDGYEGYILKEENDMWSILFENINMPIADVPFSVIKVVDVPCDETFNNVKMFGLKAIEERKGLTMEIINKIQACNSIDFLEQYLKEEGLNDSEIKDVYKKALLGNTLMEGLLDTIYSGVEKVVKKAGQVIGKAVPEIPALKTGLTNPVDAYGKPVKKTSPFYLDYAFQTAADDLKSRFKKRTPENNNCVKVQRNFDASRKVGVDIARNRDTTDKILNYFNTLEGCSEYLTHNETTGDIFKPEIRGGIIRSIEICNPIYNNKTNKLDKAKFKNFFDDLGVASRDAISKSQYYSFFVNPKFTI